MSQDSDSPPEISVAAPAYNEAEGIEAVVRGWMDVIDRLGLSAEVVVHDDGSTDGTGEILRRLAGEFPALRVVGGGRNRGYGHAAASAIEACRGEYIATIDSDGQFDLADLAAFREGIANGHPAGITGYRTQKNDRLARVVADRCLNLIVRTLFGTGLRDTNCALKLIRRDHLQQLTLESTGFSLPTEICLKLEAGGVQLGERPVSHRDRETGETKLKVVRTGWRMLRFLWYLKRQLSLQRSGIVRELKKP